MTFSSEIAEEVNLIIDLYPGLAMKTSYLNVNIPSSLGVNLLSPLI